MNGGFWSLLAGDSITRLVFFPTVAALPLTLGFFKDELFFGAARETGGGPACADMFASIVAFMSVAFISIIMLSVVTTLSTTRVLASSVSPMAFSSAALSPQALSAARPART